MFIPRSHAFVITAVLALSAGARADEEPPAKDPQAMKALDTMGAFLRDQKSFTVRTTTQTDYVLDNGQKVRLESHGDLRARRPDHLRAAVTSDRKQREYFFDGKTFTIYAPAMNYYATVDDVPGTLRELADLLADRYALQLPLVDLFRWGTEESAEDQITAARFIGPTKLDGVDVDQYAFRQPGLDWQIWIQHGDKPVPRKLVLTTTDDPARPELAIQLSWDLAARHDEDAEFTFTPPKGASKIALAAVPPTPGYSARRDIQRKPQR